jgi:CPA1 family monovalent cation:H+ antiporter
VVTGVVGRVGGGVWWPLVVALLAVVSSRAALVGVVGLLLAHGARPLRHGWKRLMLWAGLRGAVSLAAALSLPHALPQRDLLLALTFGVVLVILLVQGRPRQRRGYAYLH